MAAFEKQLPPFAAAIEILEREYQRLKDYDGPCGEKDMCPGDLAVGVEHAISVLRKAGGNVR